MERTGVQARNPEELKKTIKSLRDGNKIQAKIIKEKESIIRQLTAEIISLTSELKRAKK